MYSLETVGGLCSNFSVPYVSRKVDKYPNLVGGKDDEVEEESVIDHQSRGSPS
jgi:hypothetical protein